MLRPLYELEEKGIITLTICAPYLEDIKCHIQKNTRMVIVTHSSNVTGEILMWIPLESIVKNVAFFLWWMRLKVQVIYQYLWKILMFYVLVAIKVY